MEYVKKVAETPPADNTNTANTPPEGWRNPWRGAAIGGTFGGLLTTALGYLYGHRGRWLAYDALAGGLAGGAGGYAIDSHNNQRAEDRSDKNNNDRHFAKGSTSSKERDYEMNGPLAQWKKLRPEDRKRWLDIKKSGGFALNPFRKDTSVLDAIRNNREGWQLIARGAHKENDEDAEKWFKWWDAADRIPTNIVSKKLFGGMTGIR